MLDFVSDEISAKIAIYQDKWINNLFNTDTDKKESVYWIKQAYENAGLKKPNNTIWLSSPLEGYIGESILSQLLNPVKDQFNNMVKEYFGRTIRHYKKSSFRQVFQIYHENLEAGDKRAFRIEEDINIGIGSKLRNTMFKEKAYLKVLEKISAQVDHKLLNKLKDQEEKIKCGGVSVLGTPYTSKWQYLYDYYVSERNYNATNLLPLINMTEYCGWYHPFKRAVILTEKPKSVFFDERGHLHAIREKAIEYTDGFGIWCINGNYFPEEWASQPQDNWKAEWLFEVAPELCQFLIQKIGYDKISKEFNSKLIHLEENMELRKIYIGSNRMRLLKVFNPSTKRELVLRVPSDINTCFKAKKWAMQKETQWWQSEFGT